MALLAERIGRTREFAYLARKALDVVMIPEPHDDESDTYLRFVAEFNRSRRAALEEMARTAPNKSPIVITAFGKKIPYGERESVKHWKTYRYVTYDGDLAPYRETA